MPNRLRVGIVGLGQRWQRWSRALGLLRGLVEPVALYDPRPARAALAARELRCPLAEGPVALLEQDDVQAVLLLDAPWYGLWPLQQACRVGKPVFCAASLSRDDDGADALVELVRAARLPVLMARPGPMSPAQTRLSRLLGEELGPARLLRAERGLLLRGRVQPVTAAMLIASGPMLDMLVSTAALLSSAPTSVWASGTVAGLVSILLSYPGGQCAQLTLWADSTQGVPNRLHVVAARGVAEVEGSWRLRWRDSDNRYMNLRPADSPARALLERFVKGVNDGSPLWPGLDDAYGALRVARAAGRSLVERRAVEIEIPVY